MIHLTDSRLTRKGSLSTWKYSERFSKSVIDFQIRNLMNLLLKKKFSPSSRNLATLEILRISLPWLLIICINHGELFLQSSTSEDSAFQIDNKDIKKQEKMHYPRFTKAIIHHFLSKDKSISMRNIMFMHTAQDDSILGTLRFISKDEDTQVYGSLIPTSTGVQIRDTHGVSVSKKKEPATTDKSKGINFMSEAVLLEDAQMKKVLKRSKKENHSPQPSSSGDGVGSQSKVPDEPKGKTTGTNEGTGTKPGVPDVPKDQSKSENESWGESGHDDDSNDDNSDNDDDSDNDGGDNDSEDERTEFDEDANPNLNQNDDDLEEEYCALRAFLKVVIPMSPLTPPVREDIQTLESSKVRLHSGRKGFGLSGLSRVTGSSLGVISGDEGFCEDDYAILGS
ncbi:hypothetical protein Tco_1386314 [Tanacetum coccineum]